MQSKAVFLDRDGVLIRDTGAITQKNQIELLANVSDAIASLRVLGFNIILFSNQTVVSKGLMTYEEMLALNQNIFDRILAENSNAIFDAAYFSPYHPKAQVEKYRKDSDCRKPRPGMLLKGQKEFNLNLSFSFVIGDRLTDVYAGNSVGCQTILLATGAHQEPLIETSLELNPTWLIPHKSFLSLPEAAHFIHSTVETNNE